VILSPKYCKLHNILYNIELYYNCNTYEKGFYQQSKCDYVRNL
jgi:hypothetical protein